MLLDLDLLVFDEFGASRLKEKFSTRFVGRAIRGGTLKNNENEMFYSFFLILPNDN